MQLQKYMSELSKINILEHDAELILWQSYKVQGDLSARKKLIESYQPLVFKVATPFRNVDNIMDLLQEGTVGLIEAVEKYEYERGVAFSLFAIYRIRGRMYDYLKREGKADIACLENNSYSQGTPLEMLVDTGVTIPELVEMQEVSGKVQQAMDRLPDKEQQVLNQIYVKCLEAKEVAQNLQVSTSHIYRLQKSGVRRVRGMLSNFMHSWK